MLDFERARIAGWVLAAIVALGAHVGGVALTFMHWEQEEADDAGGTVVIELAPIAAVARVDSFDTERGPELQEQVDPLTQATKETKQDAPKEMPKVEPSPAPEPEVALPAPKPEQKEEPEEEPDKEQVTEQQDKNQQQAPQMALAPPRVDSESKQNAAPSRGQVASDARAQATWQKSLMNHLNRHKRYPEAARSRRVQGTVVIAFQVTSAGNVVASHVVRSSGSPLLDEEALNTLKRADPIPAPPPSLAAAGLAFEMPIQFKIR